MKEQKNKAARGYVFLNEIVGGEKRSLSFYKSEYCSSEDKNYEETAEKLDENTAIHLHAVH